MLRKTVTMIVVLSVALGTLVGSVMAAPPDPDKLLKVPTVTTATCPYADPYENTGGGTRDDWFNTASTLTTAGQPGHTFDWYADKDWAKFEAQGGYVYVIATSNLTPLPTGDEYYADTVLELYDDPQDQWIERSDDYGGTYASQIEWLAPEDGTYYIKIYNFNSGVYGCDVGYDLTLSADKSLQITKVAEDLNGAPLLEGDIIRYTVTVTNASTTVQHTNVVITDPIPSGTTYVANSASTSMGVVNTTSPVLKVSVGTLNPGTPGDVVTVQFDVQVDPDTTGEDIVNQAYVRSDQLDVIGTPPVTPPGGGTVEPGLVIDKTAVDANGPPVEVGDLITYTIVVTNNSSILHTNVVITDWLPSGTTFVTDSLSTNPQGTLVFPVSDILVVNMGSLAPSAGLVVEFAVTADVAEIGGNIAAVSSDQQNAQYTDPVYPPSVRVLGLYKGAEDLNGGPLYAGDELLYTVVVVNLLNEAQTNVVITDAIPSYTTYVTGSASLSLGSLSGPDPLVANVGTLQPDQKAILTFRVTVDAGSAGETIGNSAQASSNLQDPPVDVGPIEPEPYGGEVQYGEQALSITKTAEDLDGGPLYPGDEILYTISVISLLTQDPQGDVTITDYIPDYATYVDGSASVSQGSISGPDPLMALVGTLEPGEEATLSFRVTVNGDANGQVVVNSAEADSDMQNPAVMTPPVQPYPAALPGFPNSGGGWVLDGEQQIGITKAAEDQNGDPLAPGDTIEYTVVIWNEVSISQTNTVITDYIPDFTTYVADSITSTKGLTSGPDPLLVTVGTLDVGEYVTVTFQVTVDTDAGGEKVANQAFAGSDQQVPQAYTPPVVTSGDGTVVAVEDHGIYLPIVTRNL
ncbi:MAG: DUF11 domain-containing protein [Chloroflexi bacterium]|nr:DUF11 domain-containing protein [Chloroflexota bacterium]